MGISVAVIVLLLSVIVWIYVVIQRSLAANKLAFETMDAVYLLLLAFYLRGGVP